MIEVELSPFVRIAAQIEAAQKAAQKPASRHGNGKPKKLEPSTESALETARSQPFRVVELEIEAGNIGTTSLEEVGLPENNGVIDESDRESWVVIIDARKVAGSSTVRYYELRSGAILRYDVSVQAITHASQEDVKAWWFLHPITK